MGLETLRLITDEKVRKAFPVLQEVLYLNVGTYGIMPEPALAQFQAIQAEFEHRGVASDGTFGRKTEETRSRLAALIGAQAEEITFTRNATDGINLVLAGIDWQPGDEVLTLDQEHEAMMHPLLYLHQTRHIEFKLLKTSPKAGEMLAQLDQACTPRTKLVAMSLVTCETGTRLPAKEISEWAARRGIFCLFDGAQVSGAAPIKMNEIGCDFYASNGHKWLSGPKGSGFFYSRKERLAQLSPAHVGAGSLVKADIPARIGEPFLTGQRFEFGTRAWAISAGLGASLDWFDSLGWENVYAHIASLSGYLKNCVLQRPFLRLLTPVDYAESSGLVSFVVEGHVAQEVSKTLREQWKAYVRVIPHYNAIRISTAHFNLPDEIDRLMAAIDQIHAS